MSNSPCVQPKTGLEISYLKLFNCPIIKIYRRYLVVRLYGLCRLGSMVSEPCLDHLPLNCRPPNPLTLLNHHTTRTSPPQYAEPLLQYCIFAREYWHCCRLTLWHCASGIRHWPHAKLALGTHSHSDLHADRICVSTLFLDHIPTCRLSSLFPFPCE